MGTLSRRLDALEARSVDLLYRREAERLAAEYGGSAADHLTELRTLAAEVVRRFGPRPDIWEVARWEARERGLDPDEVCAHLMARKGQR
jgi:hypothetical protein